MTEQLKEWRGAFGDAYIERNPPDEPVIRRRALCFAEVLRHVDGGAPRVIVEAGCNIGLNLRALRRISDSRLIAVEPNAAACDVLVRDGIVDAKDIYRAALPETGLDDGAGDFVFTCAVLIHVADDTLRACYRELYRISSKYLLSVEYFSQNPQPVPYHGRDDLLFKRDYGTIWLDMYPDLNVVASGFFWKRTTLMDDLNWWLFRKG